MVDKTLADMRRALVALRLEAPASVAAEVQLRVWAHVEHITASLRRADGLAAFASEVLAAILADRNFFESEDSEWWCELLAKFGYAEKVKYDPETHGDIDGAEPGFDVWIFTDAMRAAAKGGAA